MAYVNFNRGLTRAQIEALTNAVNGKIYFATDGGIYVGKADGTAEEKADINYRTESKTGQEFVYRKSPATIKAKSLTLDRIYGKTLAWNQLVQNGNFADGRAWWLANGATISAANGILTWTANNATTSNNLQTAITFINGHKYYISFFIKGDADNMVNGAFGSVSGGGAFSEEAYTTSWKRIAKMATPTSNTTNYLYLWPNVSGNVGAVAYFRNIYIHDLTLLYGSEIDGLTDEQILAKFESEFPGYHDFGNKLISNDAESLETVGFNKFDESTWVVGKYRDANGGESNIAGRRRSDVYFPCLPSTQYYFGYSVQNQSWAVVVCWYDANKNFISGTNAANLIQTSPANAAFFKISGADHITGDTCINLSYPARNGTYEPYRKTTLQLGLNNFKVKDGNGNVTTFTGGLKSAGTVHDEIVGNKLIQRVGRVDLGELNWGVYTACYDGYCYYAPVPTFKAGNNDKTVANTICDNYAMSSFTAAYILTQGAAKDKVFIGVANSPRFICRDTAYSTAGAFKTAMSGHYADYELATPIEYELVEPLVYSMSAGTTEERISPNTDGLSAPFCCDITYDANANNDSANAQYAATAGRLYNAHKLWGQDFDGSNDVSGAISGATTINASGTVTGGSFVKSGGTSSQFLKADGSVDSNTYALNSNLAWNKTQQGGAILVNSGATASASGAVAYGKTTIADIIASGTGSQAGGFSEEHGLIKAEGNGSRAMGVTQLEGHIIASGHASEAIGFADSDVSEIIASERGACARGLAQDGHITASGAGSQAEGYAYGGLMQASGYGSAARGCAVNEGCILSSGYGSNAQGYSTSQGAIQATQQGAFASGYTNNATITASNKGAFATGYSDSDNSITASGLGSIAHGYTDGGSGNIKAAGKGSHAEGTSTTAIGDYSHAEGDATVAYGTGSKSEGTSTSSITISGVSGSGTSYTSSNASKLYKGALLNSGLTYARVVSISGNSFTVNNTLGSMSSDSVLMIRGCASGAYSHSEGSGSAYGDFSHVEGNETIASENGSHAEGVGTIAQNLAEHAEGRYNKSNKANDTYGNAGNTQHSIGIGTGNTRKNAFEVMQNGDIYINGTGNYDGTNPSTADTLQQQILVLTEHIAKLTAKINTLEAEIDNRGNLTANTVDVRQGYTYNGDLLILTGSGVPTTVPAFVGQFYINTSGPSLYYAINNSAASDWKQA